MQPTANPCTNAHLPGGLHRGQGSGKAASQDSWRKLGLQQVAGWGPEAGKLPEGDGAEQATKNPKGSTEMQPKEWKIDGEVWRPGPRAPVCWPS